VTPELLSAFGRFDVPQSSPVSNDYSLLQLFIDAATDQVETFAQTACLTEQVLLTLDFFPNTQDPRTLQQYELTYSYAITPWWWWGFPTRDSIELVRRPVVVPTLTGTAYAVTAVSVANNQATVTCDNDFAIGDIVVPFGTAEGNIYAPQDTPTTVPFLNGAPLTITSIIMTGSPAVQTGFTAAFNFYNLSGNQVIPQSYTNNADTGTVQLMSNPLLVTYNDQNGILQTWNTTNYTVAYDKVCLTVGNWWPLTDRRQDCIQISYWAGNTSTPADVASRLQMAVLYLANHFWTVRDIVAVEPTSEIAMTLCKILGSYRTFRVPR
jgi:hypothetical protein